MPNISAVSLSCQLAVGQIGVTESMVRTSSDLFQKRLYAKSMIMFQGIDLVNNLETRFLGIFVHSADKREKIEG